MLQKYLNTYIVEAAFQALVVFAFVDFVDSLAVARPSEELEHYN